MFTKASIIAIFASVAAAQHAAVGNPSGNAITRPLNEVRTSANIRPSYSY